MIDPNIFERQSPAIKVGILCVAFLVLLGFVLFVVDQCDSKIAHSKIDKARANVNAALEQVNAAKATVANDRVDEAVALDHVKSAANDVITASNATDDAKAQANAALANYNAAVAAKQPTGTTAEDLQRKLDALDQ